MRLHKEFHNPEDITPEIALQILKEGNFRFVNNLRINRNLLELVNETKDGQFPFATILSCMDSRTSAEIIFDQGLGDIFSIRIAGNIISQGILGSLEFATAVAGSKLIVVLGHTNCGAIKGACNDVKLGNLTSLLTKIQPAVLTEHKTTSERNGNNPDFVNSVAELNAHYSAQQILQHSDIIQNLIKENKLMVVAAMYDVATGNVRFSEEKF